MSPGLKALSQENVIAITVVLRRGEGRCAGAPCHTHTHTHRPATAEAAEPKRAREGEGEHTNPHRESGEKSWSSLPTPSNSDASSNC